MRHNKRRKTAPALVRIHEATAALSKLGQMPQLGSIDSAAQAVGLSKDEVLALIAQGATGGDKICADMVGIWALYPAEWLAERTIDEMCGLAGRKHPEILRKLVQIVNTYTGAIADLKAAAALPDVVDATIQSSKQLGSAGIEDRKILLKQQKFIIDEPKGPLVHVDQRKVSVGVDGLGFEAIIKAAMDGQRAPVHQLPAYEGVVVDADDVKDGDSGVE